MKDDALTSCPECGQEGVKRLIGRGAGIIFKGSGFYQTDYKSPASNANNKEASGGSETSAKSEGKKESAPAPSTTD
jgi:predicted nucleic acid-binding Zn ribbon protein